MSPSGESYNLRHNDTLEVKYGIPLDACIYYYNGSGNEIRPVWAQFINMGPDFKCSSLSNVGHTRFKSVTLFVLHQKSPLQYRDSVNYVEGNIVT